MRSLTAREDQAHQGLLRALVDGLLAVGRIGGDSEADGLDRFEHSLDAHPVDGPLALSVLVVSRLKWIGVISLGSSSSYLAECLQLGAELVEEVRQHEVVTAVQRHLQVGSHLLRHASLEEVVDALKIFDYP